MTSRAEIKAVINRLVALLFSGRLSADAQLAIGDAVLPLQRVAEHLLGEAAVDHDRARIVTLNVYRVGDQHGHE